MNAVNITQYIRILTGIMLLAYLFYFVGIDKIVLSISSFDLFQIVPISIILIFIILLSGLGLKILFDACTIIPNNEFFRAYFTSWALSLIIPGKIGDFSISYILKEKISIKESAAVVLIDKLISLFVISFFGILGISLFFGYDVGLKFVIIIFFIFLLLTISSIIIITLIRNNLRVFAFVKHFLSTIACFVKKEIIRIIANTLITILKLVFQTYSLTLMFQGFGVPTDFWKLFLILCIATLTSFIPTTINGLGIREGVFTYLCMQIGIPMEKSLAVSIISLFLNYVLAFIGLLISKRSNTQTNKKQIKKLRIVFVVPSTPRLSFSGLEEMTLRLAKYFKLKGNEVEIVSTSPQPKDSLVEGIPIREFNSFAPNNAYYFSPGIIMAIWKTKADIIHCSGYNNLVTLLALLGKRSTQKFVLFANRTGSNLLHRKVLIFFFDIAMNLLCYRIDKVVASSQYELENLKKTLWLCDEKKFCVIRNGVDKNQIYNVSVRKKENYIISIGRLVEHKGFSYLIRGFALVVKRIPTLKLIIVGDGPMKTELETLAKSLGIYEKVIFFGIIPFSEREKMIRMIKKSKCFIFLSSFEGDPLIVSQAICCKVPVILYEKGVLIDYIKENNCIGIKDRSNPNEVAKRIIECIKGNKGNSCKKPNCNKIQSWDDVGEKFDNIYKEVLD